MSLVKKLFLFCLNGARNEHVADTDGAAMSTQSAENETLVDFPVQPIFGLFDSDFKQKYPGLFAEMSVVRKAVDDEERYCRKMCLQQNILQMIKHSGGNTDYANISRALMNECQTLKSELQVLQTSEVTLDSMNKRIKERLMSRQIHNTFLKVDKTSKGEFQIQIKSNGQVPNQTNLDIHNASLAQLIFKQVFIAVFRCKGIVTEKSIEQLIELVYAQCLYLLREYFGPISRISSDEHVADNPTLNILVKQMLRYMILSVRLCLNSKWLYFAVKLGPKNMKWVMKMAWELYQKNFTKKLAHVFAAEAFIVMCRAAISCGEEQIKTDTTEFKNILYDFQKQFLHAMCTFGDQLSLAKQAATPRDFVPEGTPELEQAVYSRDIEFEKLYLSDCFSDRIGGPDDEITAKIGDNHYTKYMASVRRGIRIYCFAESNPKSDENRIRCAIATHSLLSDLMTKLNDNLKPTGQSSKQAVIDAFEELHQKSWLELHLQGAAKTSIMAVVLLQEKERNNTDFASIEMITAKIGDCGAMMMRRPRQPNLTCFENVMITGDEQNTYLGEKNAKVVFNQMTLRADNSDVFMVMAGNSFWNFCQQHSQFFETDLSRFFQEFQESDELAEKSDDENALINSRIGMAHQCLRELKLKLQEKGGILYQDQADYVKPGRKSRKKDGNAKEIDRNPTCLAVVQLPVFLPGCQDIDQLELSDLSDSIPDETQGSHISETPSESSSVGGHGAGGADELDQNESPSNHGASSPSFPNESPSNHGASSPSYPNESVQPQSSDSLVGGDQTFRWLKDLKELMQTLGRFRVLGYWLDYKINKKKSTIYKAQNSLTFKDELFSAAYDDRRFLSDLYETFESLDNDQEALKAITEVGSKSHDIFHQRPDQKILHELLGRLKEDLKNKKLLQELLNKLTTEEDVLKSIDLDEFELSRFIEAQKHGKFQEALSEIQNGRKTGHWMWYIIPTPPYVVDGEEKGSDQNKKFALRNSTDKTKMGYLKGDEAAKAYLTFPTTDGVNLRQNLYDIFLAISNKLKDGKTVTELFGETAHLDEPKLENSLKLFKEVSNDGVDNKMYNICRDLLDEINQDMKQESAPEKTLLDDEDVSNVLNLMFKHVNVENYKTEENLRSYFKKSLEILIGEGLSDQDANQISSVLCVITPPDFVKELHEPYKPQSSIRKLNKKLQDRLDEEITMGVESEKQLTSVLKKIKTLKDGDDSDRSSDDGNDDSESLNQISSTGAESGEKEVVLEQRQTNHDRGKDDKISTTGAESGGKEFVLEHRKIDDDYDEDDAEYLKKSINIDAIQPGQPAPQSMDPSKPKSAKKSKKPSYEFAVISFSLDDDQAQKVFDEALINMKSVDFDTNDDEEEEGRTKKQQLDSAKVKHIFETRTRIAEVKDIIKTGNIDRVRTYVKRLIEKRANKTQLVQISSKFKDAMNKVFQDDIQMWEASNEDALHLKIEVKIDTIEDKEIMKSRVDKMKAKIDQCKTSHEKIEFLEGIDTLSANQEYTQKVKELYGKIKTAIESGKIDVVSENKDEKVVFYLKSLTSENP